MVKRALLVAALLLLTACGTTVSGTPTARPPTSARVSTSAAPPVEDYPTPPDGTGFSTSPFDQPSPAPDLFMPGSPNTCQWLTPAIAKAAGGTGQLVSTASGCQAHLPKSTDIAQISMVGPYIALTEPVRFSRPITIGGLQARERAFTSEPRGDCDVELNTRSYTAPSVVVFNRPKPETGDPVERCAIARRFMTVIAKAYVPLAGGKPWPGTRQRPGPKAGDGKTACEIADEGVAVYGGMYPRSDSSSTTPLGETCSYKSHYSASTAKITVTAGTKIGLAQVPPVLPGAASGTRTVGVLPARQEQTDTECALSSSFCREGSSRSTTARSFVTMRVQWPMS